MTRISSGTTYFYKRVFPAIWFGLVGVFVCLGGSRVFLRQQIAQSLTFIGMLLFVSLVCYMIMRSFIFDLVDEVWDDGDSLVVRNKGIEQRFRMSAFKNVNYTRFTNPPRVTLSLGKASVFGMEIAFIPPMRLFQYSMPPIAGDLIERIDAARRAV